MSPALIACVVDLADVLARENAALEAMDLPRAAAMLDEKLRAAAAFAAAREQDAAGAGPDAPPALARQVTERLSHLAEENRVLLERGIGVQGRLIACIARTAPRPPTSRYRQDGGMRGERSAPVALSARA